jgi:hypothetical protein
LAVVRKGQADLRDVAAAGVPAVTFVDVEPGETAAETFARVGLTLAQQD